MASSESRRPIGFEDRLLAEAVRACEETRGASFDDKAANAEARAATLAQLGRTEEAGTVARRFVKNVQAELRERGETKPSRALDIAKMETAFFRWQTEAEQLLDGLRKAGLDV